MSGYWEVVSTGRCAGSMSQLTICFWKLAVQKKLSGREKRLEHMCSRVGMPLGSAISISCSASRPIRFSAARSAGRENRWVSSFLSHRG